MKHRPVWLPAAPTAAGRSEPPLSATLTPLDVRRAVDALAAKVAPATVRTNLGVLRAVLNAAVEADLISRTPVRGIKLETAGMRPADPHTGAARSAGR